SLEGDGDGGGGGAAALHLPDGQGGGVDVEVVAGVGLDPEADLLEVGPVELDVHGDAAGADEPGGVHLGHDVCLFAGLQVGPGGRCRDAAARDADAEYVDGVACLVDDSEAMGHCGAARDRAEVLGELVKQPVGPGGRVRGPCRRK